VGRENAELGLGKDGEKVDKNLKNKNKNKNKNGENGALLANTPE